MPKLTDEDLITITTLQLQEAQSYLDEEVSEERARALRDYNGDNPAGLPLTQGRSQMVSTDVRDAIEWILPDLVKIFTGGDQYVAIEPQGEDDNFDADAAQEWVNFVVMRQNPGFLNTYTWIKDALLSKHGFLKQYWEVEEQRERQDYEGLTEEEYEFLKAAEDFDMADHTTRYVMEDPETRESIEVPKEFSDREGVMPLYDVTGYQITEEAKICEEPVPPERVLFLSDTGWIPHDCRFVGIEMEKTLGELREMGYDVDDDIQGPPVSSIGLYDNEELAREHDTSGTIGLDGDGDETTVDPTLRKVWFYEVYSKLDRDGDGQPEWLKIHRVGSEVLSVEEVDYPNLYAICPVLWPHRFVGLSIADLLTDIQKVMTALNRQVLDHIYLSNNPRSELDVSGMTEDTIDDLLDNRIGGYVRVKRPGTVNPLQVTPLQPWTFNVIESWEQKKEARTGVTRYSGGLDPNALNKTASGVFQLISQAARRIELIARIFAETGFKDRIRGILDLSAKYPDYVGERILRLTNKQVELTPDKLKGRFDLVVDAGIGAGNTEQTSQHIMNLLGIYQQMFQAGLGPGSERAIVTTENIFNAVRQYVANALGKRNTSDYLTDPTDPNAERDPVVQPPPSETEVEMQKFQAEMQLKQQEAQWEHEEKLRELDLKERELELKERELGIKEFEAAQPGPRRASGE